MGAEGLEPPSVSWRRQIYSLAQSPLCHTPDTPRTGIEPVPTPRQGAMRSVTPTRPNQQGEQGNRTLATTFTVSRAATTPNSPTHLDRNLFPQPRMYMRGFPTRKRRDSNPHRPTERPRLANACDETDIRLSS